jgi:hypothetical protein
MSCKPRNPQVLVQIGQIDTLLQTSGVRDYCLECIKGPKGGCCQGCSLLGTDGCTNKPLSCALWLCFPAAVKFQEVAKQLKDIAHNYPTKVAHGYRGASLSAESELM